MLEARIIFITLCFSFYAGCHGMFTPLEIDNHPCQPENLKVHFPARASPSYEGFGPIFDFKLQGKRSRAELS